MSYVLETGDQNSGSNNVQQGNFKKADAFLNLYLPKGGNSKGKLEAVKLYADNADHKQLMDLFESDPEKAADLVRKHIIMQYNRADGERQLFDLTGS